ncbi:MAG: DUF1080 domain-containing protein [Tannerellaceae bacterium]|nr:DUF1080 domain-containing protein [Tannerellaceae bacterium]
MRKVVLLSILFTTLSSGSLSAQKNNVLTDQEKQEGWTLLFDGKSFDGWRKCNSTDMAAN